MMRLHDDGACVRNAPIYASGPRQTEIENISAWSHALADILRVEQAFNYSGTTWNQGYHGGFGCRERERGDDALLSINLKF